MDNFLTGLINFSPFLLIKIPILVLLFLYIIYALIILRQTMIMSKIVEVDVTPTLQFITLIHFLASIAIFFWVLFFL
ncbi:hypothetical protein A2773_03790 [Candidatus Gottesmanbacteria bacterium RIFCSPHIGHO2_01_FULL_39_10]|uniref:Uncharacterized protein n=1 Tax=Candidatus Gottesmanbacteria bacterium RIFCSPHIGHO2_01_FULL_39_10 TaxID=1798375 RepID=A0A1F5ZP56_9BACT|nr:MAG: hypothetical protein A2773_03790 [Candidatus Gottesmanbacteria bacterium RIFCSPHIGHO2_01_FULL_39_10]